MGKLSDRLEAIERRLDALERRTLPLQHWGPVAPVQPLWNESRCPVCKQAADRLEELSREGAGDG